MEVHHKDQLFEQRWKIWQPDLYGILLAACSNFFIAVSLSSKPRLEEIFDPPGSTAEFGLQTKCQITSGVSLDN